MNSAKKAENQSKLIKHKAVHFCHEWRLVPFLFVHGMVLFYDNRKLSNVVETHFWFDESNKNNQKCNWGPSINDIAF